MKKITKQVWKPEIGGYCVNGWGRVVFEPIVPTLHRSFGTARKTQAEAEAASAKMRAYNRLLAYVDEHDVPDGTYFYVFEAYGKFGVTRSFTKSLGTVYMSEATAHQLAKELNEGTVVL
jgi:hypothetical protein